MRKAAVKRKTAETDIALELCLDGTGTADIDTGVGFLDHMLTLTAKHGRLDLSVRCAGDTRVGDKRGIRRYGSIILPMDEALVLCAVDLSGRSLLRYSLELRARKVGTFDTELAEEFFLAFTRAAGVTLHLRQLDGRNTHHILEAAFKGFGRALREAVAADPDAAGEIPSTKGTLE